MGRGTDGEAGTEGCCDGGVKDEEDKCQCDLTRDRQTRRDATRPGHRW